MKRRVSAEKEGSEAGNSAISCVNLPNDKNLINFLEEHLIRRVL